MIVRLLLLGASLGLLVTGCARSESPERQLQRHYEEVIVPETTLPLELLAKDCENGGDSDPTPCQMFGIMYDELYVIRLARYWEAMHWLGVEEPGAEILADLLGAQDSCETLLQRIWEYPTGAAIGMCIYSRSEQFPPCASGGTGDLQDNIEGLERCLERLAEEATGSFLPSPSPVGAATTIRQFQPFAEGELSPTLKVEAREAGRCGIGSLKDDGRPDAWRCMIADGHIFDPCFQDPSGSQAFLVCAGSPFTDTVTLLDLTEPLPPRRGNSADSSNSLPWALVLADGRQCTFMGGATDAIPQGRLNYGCSDGGVIYGGPDKSAKLWTALWSASVQMYDPSPLVDHKK